MSCAIDPINLIVDAASSGNIRPNLASCLRFAKKLSMNKIKVVVFDLDQTSTTEHSGGALLQDQFSEYTHHVSLSFQRIVPILLKRGFKVGIASFTDKKYYGIRKELTAETHLAGEDLIEKFLYKIFDYDIAKNIAIYGAYPGLCTDITNDKNCHMKEICKLHDEPLDRAILFDDTLRNIENAEGYNAYLVNGSIGFCLADYTEKA